jgi:ABC-type lipoprotein export system ATPase subunit
LSIAVEARGNEVALAKLRRHRPGRRERGGQQQRVAVARALALLPRSPLVDEPTSQQDPDNRALVMGRVLGAAEHGATVLVATHDPEFAARCDRTILLGQKTT